MGVYLGYVQTVANRLSVESFADMSINWMQSKKLLEDPQVGGIFSGFNQQSIDSAIQIASRVAYAYFIYPRVSPIISLMNVAIGVVHLCVGVTERFRTTEKPTEAPAKWNEIALNIHKGFAHLLTAGYDFGIGYLLKREYINVISAIAFSAFPVAALMWHQSVYAKPGEVLINPEAQNQLLEKLVEITKDHMEGSALEQINNKILNAIKPPPLPANPQEQVVPTYLTPRCYIYAIAKKITLELMPPTEPITHPLAIRFVNTLRRVSGVGEVVPLPNYGL